MDVFIANALILPATFARPALRPNDAQLAKRPKFDRGYDEWNVVESFFHFQTDRQNYYSALFSREPFICLPGSAGRSPIIITPSLRFVKSVYQGLNLAYSSGRTNALSRLDRD